MRLTIFIAVLLIATNALADTSRLCSRFNMPSTFPPGTVFKATGKGIVDPNGRTVTLRGVQVFDSLFITFEFRGYNGTRPINQIYRQIFNPGGKGPGTGISEPTYNAKFNYKNHGYVLSQLTRIKGMGFNMIRIIVEPAVEFASVSYVDPIDGNTYPSDPTMLDDIVNTATGMGLVVNLTMGRDEANFDPVFPNGTFMAWLGGRYKSNPLVWINTANEYSGTPFQTSPSTTVPNPFSGDVSTWATNEGLYINDVRGSGFTNPIILNDPHFAANISAIYSTITTTAPFDNDGNLLYGIHAYTGIVSGSGATLVVESSWQQSLANIYQTNVFQYLGSIPMFLEEVGSSCATCGAAIYDPEFGTSLNVTTWGQMQSWGQSIMAWALTNSGYSGALGGINLRSWFQYIPTNNPDPSAFFFNSLPTAWMKSVRRNLLTLPRDDCTRRHLFHRSVGVSP